MSLLMSKNILVLTHAVGFLFLRAYYGMGFREAVFELTGSGVGKK